MPSSMTLHYFDFTGRAEATRLALAYTGKDFEDHRMNFQEYGASKWAGQGLPVLDVRQRGRERERERVVERMDVCKGLRLSAARKRTMATTCPCPSHAPVSCSHAVHSHPLPAVLRPQIDGTEYTQSLAMLKYAGKMGGLYPEDDIAALKVCTSEHLQQMVLPLLVATGTA